MVPAELGEWLMRRRLTAPVAGRRRRGATRAAAALEAAAARSSSRNSAPSAIGVAARGAAAFGAAARRRRGTAALSASAGCDPAERAPGRPGSADPASSPDRPRRLLAAAAGAAAPRLLSRTIRGTCRASLRRLMGIAGFLRSRSPGTAKTPGRVRPGAGPWRRSRDPYRSGCCANAGGSGRLDACSMPCASRLERAAPNSVVLEVAADNVAARAPYTARRLYVVGHRRRLLPSHRAVGSTR